MERYFRHLPGANPADDDIVARSRNVPVATASVTYSSARSSALGISAEEGFTTRLGTRTYFDTLRGAITWKGLFTHTQYLRLSAHSVLVPSLKASWSSIGSDYFDSTVVLTGGQTDVSSNLTEMRVRGYPYLLGTVRAAGIAGLDYRFPIARVFRGAGTNPVFLENLYGFVFGEVTFLPGSLLEDKAIPSAGGGLKLDTDLINLPITLSLEYQRGFRTDLGVHDQLLLQIAGGSLPI
jgi:hypothetical protein